MITSHHIKRVFARRHPTDLRKGFNGLYRIVLHELHLDPMSGDAFLFLNRTRTSAKLLVWDGTGLCVLSKRLAKGRFDTLWNQKHHPPLTFTMEEFKRFFHGAKRIKLSE